MENNHITCEMTREEARAVCDLVGGLDGHLAMHIFSHCCRDSDNNAEEVLRRKWALALRGWHKIHQTLEGV